jgi:hypothetical protein
MFDKGDGDFEKRLSHHQLELHRNDELEEEWLACQYRRKGGPSFPVIAV